MSSSEDKQKLRNQIYAGVVKAVAKAVNVPITDQALLSPNLITKKSADSLQAINTKRKLLENK